MAVIDSSNFDFSPYIENKRFVIVDSFIGNGFDVALGCQSRYSDFYRNDGVDSLVSVQKLKNASFIKKCFIFSGYIQFVSFW